MITLVNAQCSQCPSGSTTISGSTDITDQNNVVDYCVMGIWTGTIQGIANGSTITICDNTEWQLSTDIILQKDIYIENFGNIIGTGSKLFIQGQTELFNSSTGAINVATFENQDTEFTNEGLLVAENIYLHGPSINSGLITSTADCGGAATIECGFYIGNKNAAFVNTGTVEAVDANLRDAVIGGPEGNFNVSGTLQIENNSATVDNSFIVNNLVLQPSSTLNTGSFQMFGILDCNNANVESDVVCFLGAGIMGSDCSNSSDPITQCSILPVEVLDFKANYDEKLIVTWEALTEVNVSHYEVQLSKDGQSYSTIDNIKAKGDSYYQSTTNLSINNSIYYIRLKVVDNDGTIEYPADTRTINIDALDKISFSPNPVSNGKSLDIYIPNKREITTVSLYDLTGQLLKIRTYEGSDIVTFDIDGVEKSGMYVLKINTGSIVLTEELFIF